MSYIVERAEVIAEDRRKLAESAQAEKQQQFENDQKVLKQKGTVNTEMSTAQ
tara:strand:- start:184 stop:339 length:156 start_codon:yes stop_codon:yes gene_type:complete